MKGIILAGGAGTRLHPLTLSVSKQLLPVYNKPMIYYSLSTLMLAGVRDILIISTPEDLPQYRRLLADGEWLGIRLSYAEQAAPRGVAEAFLIGEEFIAGGNVALALGDNLLYGDKLPKVLRQCAEDPCGATIFGYYVRNPGQYGVLELDSAGRPLSIEEKPAAPKSHWAVPGLYFYDNRAVGFARALRPSARGELEITDINKAYLAAGALTVRLMGRGMAWLDTGTHESLLQASDFIRVVEARQGLMIGAVEEVAFRMGYITAEQLVAIATPMGRSEYGQQLLAVAAEGSHA